ncbi:MAG TPA: L,D-transpeptidase family protein [Blastocatellia bacterium]|nr:L,D-transpeptidase family protein [Blastocatellia bacterium]
MKRNIAFLFVLVFVITFSSNVQAQKRTHKRAVQTKTAQQVEPPADVLAAKQRLSDLGYWVGPVNDKSDTYLRQSLIAFQKVEGRPRTGKLTADELQALQSAKRPEPLEKTGNEHVEVDLQRQVLFVVDGQGAVSSILPVSTGSGKMFTSEGRTRKAVTPTGQFKITRKIKAMHKSPLGLLYYPNYLVDGIAIHGNPSVPSTPASHGCIRIPMYAAVEFTNRMPIGTPVTVYRSDVNVQTSH